MVIIHFTKLFVPFLAEYVFIIALYQNSQHVKQLEMTLWVSTLIVMASVQLLAFLVG